VQALKALVISALAVSPILAAGEDTKGPATKSFGPASKAIRMTEQQLDQVTAGLTLVFITNPGNAQITVLEGIHNNSIHCINCEGSGPTSGQVIIHNPARDRIHCIGGSC